MLAMLSWSIANVITQLLFILMSDIQFERLVHCTINGMLAWTCQNATGNRGDDFRALKLCDMQPYELLHPNLETDMYCVLGLQDESKTSKQGMKTVHPTFLIFGSMFSSDHVYLKTVNPTYATFIAHRNPEMCPLGAMAIYHHYLHYHFKLAEKMGIDWTRNSSWRNVS